MATLLSDLHLRINGIEAHRTAPTGESTSQGRESRTVDELVKT
jgi:hypothetical protein